MANKQYLGSLEISKILELAAVPHSGFYRGKNKKAYANIAVWVNDEVDKYGNMLAIQLMPVKGSKSKIEFIGHAKDPIKKKASTKKTGDGLNF